jgi:AcrR family transcriptional regulator
MTRSSKKRQIAQAALPLFLANGFKGTSVDMVVKASGVSKPTIYKHFPDKATLLAHVMVCWLEAPRTEPLKEALSRSRNVVPEQAALLLFKQQLDAVTWPPETFQLYRLVLAEGWRFLDARCAFESEFVRPCKNLIYAWAVEESVSAELLQAVFSHFLLERLWSVPRDALSE